MRCAPNGDIWDEEWPWSRRPPGKEVWLRENTLPNISLELKEDRDFRTIHNQCIHLHLYIPAYRVYISFHSFTISGISSSSVSSRKWGEGPKHVAHLLSVIRGQPHLYLCVLCLNFTIFYWKNIYCIIHWVIWLICTQNQIIHLLHDWTEYPTLFMYLMQGGILGCGSTKCEETFTLKICYASLIIGLYI